MLKIKLVIWDADETLWEGKLIYGNVYLKNETAEVLKQLNKLGIIQVICSKNDKEPLELELKKFNIDKYFNSIYASWEPKNFVIKDILQKYNIEPEETLFIDDETINREEIKQLVGCHVDFDSDLFNIMKYFDTDRLLLMKQERRRQTAQNEFRGTFEEFLENSGMVFEIKKGHTGMLTRITNLANRTNELNAARNRYSEEEIKRILESPEYIVYVVFLKDKYGDYGLIAETIIEKSKDTWSIKDLCVSCRVMGRGVGTKLLKYILEQSNSNNIKRVEGYVKLDDDNFRMHKLYDSAGFKVYIPEGAKDGYRYFEFRN